MSKCKIKFIFNQSTEFYIELHNLTKHNWNTSRDNRGDVISNHSMAQFVELDGCVYVYYFKAQNCIESVYIKLWDILC